VTVDEAGFDAAMKRQREQARAPASSRCRPAWNTSGAATTFHGYEHLAATTARSPRCTSTARRCSA
jgi:alanyl-tRNA synthetase